MSAVPAQSSALPDVGPQSTADTHVIYSYYPFLKADFSLMSEQDVRFLDSQGCFKIPGRQAVDQFIRVYFLHVHSGLPLLDESAFWKMYSTSGNLPRSTPCLSLFVFQAILFVSCSVRIALFLHWLSWLTRSSFCFLQPSDLWALNPHGVQGRHTTGVPRYVYPIPIPSKTWN